MCVCLVVASLVARFPLGYTGATRRIWSRSDADAHKGTTFLSMSRLLLARIQQSTHQRTAGLDSSRAHVLHVDIDQTVGDFVCFDSVLVNDTVFLPPGSEGAPAQTPSGRHTAALQNEAVDRGYQAVPKTSELSSVVYSEAW